jgi:hypothetical protein
MRMSEFLRASFVGALLFTPAMADEIEQVHQEALRVLREKLGQSNSSAPSSRLDQADPEIARVRAEREARIKAEAQQRMAERDRLQAERRQQLEQFVKDRERVRQEQREYDVNVARQTGLVRESDYNEVHARALEALHQAQIQQQNPVNAAPAGFAASPSTETNPRVVVQASSALSSSTQTDSADVHAKALEVLRQQTQGSRALTTSTTVLDAPNAAPQPSPDLQRRLKEMQAELEQEQLQKRTATTSIPDDYVADLERRARETTQGTVSPAAGSTPPIIAPAPSGLDASTREIIERQNREIARGLGSTTPSTRPAPTFQQPAPAPTPAPAITPASAAPQTAVTHTTTTDTASVQYSRELEERARQILLERAGQNVQTTPAPTTTVTTTSPVPAATPTPTPAPITPPSAAVNAATAAANNVSSAPVTTPLPDANVSDVHGRALQTLNQIQAGEGTVPKTKMQRLKELTDLYRADKMGPTEYHQKRAQILAEPQ